MSELKEEDFLHLPCTLYKTGKQIRNESKIFLKGDQVFKPELEVYYIYGPPASGKSKKALEIITKSGLLFNPVKYVNNFWLCVSDKPVACLYDNFRDSHMPASEFINFIDYNKQVMNTKGGFIINNYRLIIITSVQSPTEIYQTMTSKFIEPQKQWLR